MNLYDKIFQTANGNMQSFGMKFSFNQPGFRCILFQNPRMISVEEFADLEQEDFLTAVYLRCLNRLPDALAKKQLIADCENEEEEKFAKYKMLTNVSRSAEFKGMDKTIIGMDNLRWDLVKNGSWKLKLRIVIIEAMAAVKYVIKKWLFSPIWKRLSLDKKMKIKAWLIREN